MKNIFRTHRRNPPQHNEEQQTATPFFNKTNDSSNGPFFSKSNSVVQTKLSVGQPGDVYEQEADAVADAVVQNQQKGTAPAIQQKGISSIQRTLTSAGTGAGTAEERMKEDQLVQEKQEPGIQKMDKPLEEDEAVKPPALQKMDTPKEEEDPLAKGAVQKKDMPKEEEDPLAKGAVQKKDMPKEEEEKPGAAPAVMAKSDGTQTASPQLSQGIESSKGSGSALPDTTRAEMEASFGHDFSGVNIHTGQEATDLNQDLHAQAFTHGQDVYFNAGKYSPETTEGKRLLAHELTHVVQQGGGNKGSVQATSIQKNIIQRNDAAFESGSGLDTAIASGTMSADGIMGQTYMADNCRGLFGCNVGFNFEKAYKGTYPYSAAGRDVKGVYVKIASVYDHSICGSCDSIRLIQTVRNIKRGTGGGIETADPNNPTRQARSGWSDPAAPSRGWRVDRLVSATVPYYGVASFSVQNGSSSQPAILWDAPGDWSTDTNAGKEFQTFFVCETNSGANRVTIGGVNWGYHINSAGDISFLPATPIATCGASQELQDSSQRWDGIAGNQATGIDFSGERGVAHEADRPRMWFGLDSTNLRNDATAPSEANYAQTLRFIREHIMATSPLTRIIIHGYSSSDGDASYNRGLSERRAEAIRARLIADGIPANILELQVHGENSELSPQDMNRRVEVQMTRFTFGDIMRGIGNLLFGQGKEAAK